MVNLRGRETSPSIILKGVREIRIACDIDGTVANLTDELVYRLKEDGIDAHPEHFIHEKTEEIFEVGKEWMAHHLSDPTIWLNCTPYEDAWHMINKWFMGGHDIYFVTGRWLNSSNATYRWLEEWDIPFNEIHFNAPHGNKASVVRALDCEIMIEDRVSEATPLMEAKIKTFLINRTWNEDFDTPALRVNSFYELDGLL